MKKRNKPCICVECEHRNIFMASSLKPEYQTDNEMNKEFLDELAKYCADGYNASFKDSSEFELSYCKICFPEP